MTPPFPQILILEDTESLSKMVSATLQDAFPDGLILVAGGLRQAREFIREHRFDLLILDVNLPDGKGPDFLHEAQQLHPGVKAVFLTGSPLPAYQEQAQALGAIAFLRKPTRMTRLRKVVSDILAPPPAASGDSAELSFRGILSQLTPMDLVQLKCLAGATVALEFDQPGTGTGRVYFENGRIIHAEAGQLRGEEAFYAIAVWKHGSVTEIGDAHGVPATIEIPWANLLMNAAQLRDETTAPAAATLIGPAGGDAGTQSAETAAMPGGAKVLVAEDDAIVAHLLRSKLNQQGFTVLTAEDGASALSMVQTEKPALVIMDVMMPIVDGFQVLTEMKSSPALKSIPVILVTSKGRDVDIERGLELGAADYMVKPFSSKELMARIKKAMREAKAG